MGDSATKHAVSPLLLVDRSRAQRCSEALRSLLMRPSSLLQNRNSTSVLQGSRSRSESLELTKCGFAELAKYLYGGEKLLAQTCNNTKLECCGSVSRKDDEKISYVIKKEECTFVSEGPQNQMENKSRRGEIVLEGSKKNEPLPDKKQWNTVTKCKRKIKPESNESSSGSNSESQINSVSDEKGDLSPSLNLSYVHLPVSIDLDHASFESFKEDSKVDEDQDKGECDYDTFRKFKRFRKCLPAHPMPVSVTPRGCQCNLESLIKEINSSKQPLMADSGTQCLRNLTDASTQYDIPATATCSKKSECESENGVTEGISLVNEIVLKCFHCGITFEDDVIFSIHMGCHCHRDPFICNLCGRQCDNKYVFNTHILRGHQPS